MRVRHILAAAPLLLGACGNKQDAEKIYYYEVKGETCEDVKQWISNPEHMLNYPGESKAYVGYATTFIGYECDFQVIPQNTGSNCCTTKPDNIDTYCKATTYLPQWDGNDKCWDRLMDRLKAHEQRHASIGCSYAGRLENALSVLESTACSAESIIDACINATDELDKKIDEIFSGIIHELRSAHSAYDAETSHGKTQGTVLDCNCE
ncbi:MAG: DUF922 domain-containing Zn-dependent protease [Nanoarchaeota archaeon]|nr:DUF922 domain-containing Zn-dependent protease [Nanoarchaeota archaeon]